MQTQTNVVKSCQENEVQVKEVQLFT